MKNLGIINLNKDKFNHHIDTLIKEHSSHIPFTYLNMDNIKNEIKKFDICGLIIFANEYSDTLDTILSLFLSHIGPLTNLELIVSDDISINFMANAFEYGINNFSSSLNFNYAFIKILDHWHQINKNQDTLEYLIISNMPLIKSGKPSLIQKALEQFAKYSHYDYLAAYCQGICWENLGDFKKAIESYERSLKMNHLFLPAANALADNLLNVGKISEAIKLLQDLDYKNPFFISRKAALSISALALNNIQLANNYFTALLELSTNHPKVIEAKIQFLLKEGKNTEAFNLLDNITEAGSFFCSLINQLAIKLSHKGKIKESLALYKKLYSIVRAELKYKISINAALACYRADLYDQALFFVEQARQDYGSNFEKLIKIKEEIIKAQQNKNKQLVNNNFKKAV